MPKPLLAVILGLPAFVAALPLAAVLVFHQDASTADGRGSSAFVTVSQADHEAIADTVPVAYGVGTDDCRTGHQAPDSDG